MRIAIDGSPALGTQTGIGKYTFNLIQQLSLIDKHNEYLIYLNYFRPGKKNLFDRHFKIVKNKLPAKIQRFLQNRAHIPIELYTGKLDIFHSTNYFIAPTRRAKKILTIHDLTFFLYPETMIGSDAAYYRKYVPVSVNRADHIIAVSNSTKKGLIEHLGVPEEKITVTHEGANKEFRFLKDIDLIKTMLKKYRLPDEFMLTVCTLEPRKNLKTLVKSLNILKKQKKLEQKLVVAGGSGWKNKELFKLIHELGLDEDIIFPGYVDQQDLPALYNACSIFLFPSLYEGFGIPPLEALSCGKACICSNSSSIPEVVGDAAILIEPLNVEQWAEEIASLMNNPAKIKELGEKGLIQASKFSWKKMAEETLAVYKKIAGN